jgi:lysozyme family protein
MNFDQAFQRLIGNEGGYVADSRDPGGETNFGITKRTYPREDIAGMTLDRAKAIYRRDFWGPAGCDAWPDAIKFEVFDLAVNSGCRTAVRLVQRAVDADDDGVIGPQTLMRAQSADPAWLLRRLQAHRLKLFTSLKTFSAFGAGWVNRIANNMLA